MAEYRLIIKPISPFQTPIQSDTLFGHICWALRYLVGENELAKFLKSFTTDTASFIISSAFPEGYLPMPMLRPLTPDEEDTLFSKFNYKSRLEFYNELKPLKKVNLIEIKAIEMLKDKLSYYNLYEKHIEGEICIENPDIYKIAEVWHNAKNRLTDKVMEGKLFAKEDIFYSADIKLVVFIDDFYFGKRRLLEIFDFIARSGFGADKSSGRGYFTYELIDGWSLPKSDNPNAFVSLSNYYPCDGDFQEGFYNTLTKFGKLGGHWASGVAGGPFKRPVFLLTPGSVFITNNQKSFYGQLINNVHKKKEIVHYGITLPLKVRVV